MRSWILLVYRIPNEPSAGRVFIWRKLKKLGAILLHDAVWVLPSNPQTRERFRWLAAEIVELKGEASVWESRLTMGNEDDLVAQFTAVVEPLYREIMTEIRSKDIDLAALSRKFQSVRALDYFDNELGQQVRECFIAAKGESQ